MKTRILLFISALIFCCSAVLSQTPTPKVVNAGIVNGKAVSLTKPEYPPAARAIKASGVVKVQVTINERGDVIEASAASGHMLLRAASERAALESEFSPTMLMGQPVKVTGVIVYNFAPTTESTEEKLWIMGLGAFLSLSQFIEFDADMDLSLKELGAAFSQNENEIGGLLGSINKDTPFVKRAETLNRVSVLFRQNLVGDEAWQFDLGKGFSELMLEMKSIEENNSNSPATDQTALKSKILRINSLAGTAPESFPKDVLAKIKEISKFADDRDLSRDETKQRLAELILETLNTISPD